MDQGDEPALSRLLSRGADPNSVDGCGSTALQRAASEGKEGCVGLLLEAGAAVDQTDEHPVTWASYGETALLNAVCKGHIAICGLLLEAGAAVDQARKSDG